jgi:hypothetical protein
MMTHCAFPPSLSIVLPLPLLSIRSSSAPSLLIVFANHGVSANNSVLMKAIRTNDDGGVMTMLVSVNASLSCHHFSEVALLG